MRIILIFVLSALTLIVPSHGKDYSISGGSFSFPKVDYAKPVSPPPSPPPLALPNTPPKFEFAKPPVIDIPGVNRHEKAYNKKDFKLDNYNYGLDSVQTDYGASNVQTYSDDDTEYFGIWTLSGVGGMGCKLSGVAEHRRSIFAALSHRVIYETRSDGNGELIVSVPRAPHPKGLPVASIGSRSFPFVPQSATTFLPAPKSQPRLLKEMRAGTVMVVTWTEQDGTRWEDRYALDGIADAMLRQLQACPPMSVAISATGRP